MGSSLSRIQAIISDGDFPRFPRPDYRADWHSGIASSDSANGRASASGAGGPGFNPWPCHTKGVKNGTRGYLAWRSAL